MKFRVVFDTEAEAEIREAIEWYDSQTSGVGQRFASEVRAALSEATDNPRRFAFAGPTTQKIKVLGWPYSLYFTLLENQAQLIVISVFHGARNPEELRRRLK
jgi:plasmid stabilization system protein ParE